MPFDDAKYQAWFCCCSMYSTRAAVADLRPALLRAQEGKRVGKKTKDEDVFFNL